MQSHVAGLTKPLTFASLLLTIALTACGGGGSDEPTTTFPRSTLYPAQGFYNGTTSNNFAIGVVVLEQGEFWAIYARDGLVYGAVHGRSSAIAPTFNASGVDFYLPSGTRTATSFSGTFEPKTSMAGTISSTGATFTATYDASYEVPASLADVVGTWTGQVASPAGVQAASVTIGADGSYQGFVSANCAYSGSARPRPSGAAVFDMSITFAGSGCVFNGATLSGIAVLNTVGSSRVLVTAALLPDGSSGFMGIGTR